MFQWTAWRIPVIIKFQDLVDISDFTPVSFTHTAHNMEYEFQKSRGQARSESYWWDFSKRGEASIKINETK